MIGGPEAEPDDELLHNYDQDKPSTINNKKTKIQQKIITVSSLLALHLCAYNIYKSATTAH